MRLNKHRLWGGLWAAVLALSVLAAPLPVTAQTAVDTHYWLGRPVPKTSVQRPALGFPYGWHRRNQSPIHHGLDFINRTGSSVVAAADGVVVFAGSDAETVIGPEANFYGNAVVLQHDLTAPEGGTVFTLYGHMKKIDVTVGQRVAAGDSLGQVGMTGIAIGPHVHMEVRIGDGLNYNAVRNPELWYPPLAGNGTVIGRIIDSSGNVVMGIRFAFSNKTSVYPGFTYAEPSMPSDPAYNENFTMGDLPAGCYSLRVRGGAGLNYNEQVCIKSGETIFLEVRLQ